MDKRISDFNVRLRTIKLRELAIGVLISMILIGILIFAFPEIFENENVVLFLFIFFIILFFAYALKGTTGLKKNFDKLFEKNNQRDILIILITNLLFVYLIVILISCLDIIIGLNDPTWISMWDIDRVDVDSSVFIIDTITAILFAPVLEELIFRGVLFNRLKIRTGIIPAMIVSSFLFAIGHDFGGITSAFLFGLCMCIVYLKTDNILVPMSIHFLNNVIVGIMDLFYFDSIIGQMPWMVPGLILSIIGTILLIKYIINESRLLKKKYK